MLEVVIMAIGEQIKKYRKLQGLTQKQLSKLMNRSNALIGFWETNDREPSNDDLVKLSSNTIALLISYAF